MGESTFRVAMSNYKNHVAPHFGDMPLKSITADRCQELLDRLIDEDKVRTEENVFTMLNMIFKAAVKHGVMAHNPIDMVFHTKHEREHGKALTKDEERKLLEQTAGTPYQLMFAIALYTGLRPNEYKTAVIDGDFVGEDTNLLLNLQSLVEELGSVCMGQVWVVCVAVEHARVLFEVLNHRARLRFGVLAVQLSVGGHIFIDIVAAVRHFIIRSFPRELLALFRRGVAPDFPRRVSDVEDNWLIAYCFSSCPV